MDPEEIKKYEVEHITCNMEMEYIMEIYLNGYLYQCIGCKTVREVRLSQSPVIANEMEKKDVAVRYIGRKKN